ncbi:MAG: FHA domain-containing protein [Lachnospiraceae bacterium]|nr:FHA domain-containing protein [Lachnospiraceae bacterium]
MRILNLILILVSASATVGIIVMIRELIGSRRRGGSRSGVSFVVRGGVDVRSERPGERKGDFFDAKAEDSGTILMGGEAQSLWRITLTDQTSGEQYMRRVHHSLLIGRQPSPGLATETLVISGDPLVSRDHCLLYADGRGLSVKDMGAKNPVSVNSREIGDGLPLQSGDLLGIGSRRYKLTYRIQ